MFFRMFGMSNNRKITSPPFPNKSERSLVDFHDQIFVDSLIGHKNNILTLFVFSSTRSRRGASLLTLPDESSASQKLPEEWRVRNK